jgi:hypothetical protein
VIVSASRRTDIPAFYSEWFFNRVAAGYALVPNPFNPNQISRVSLKPADVDAIVFWTRNPGPMLGRLPQLDGAGYRYYFQFTITPYNDDLEPHLPMQPRQIETFQKLADAIGPARVVWRYDPIIISNKTSFAFHEVAFDRMAAKLAGATDTVMISFVDWYKKTKRRMGGLPCLGWEIDFEPKTDPRVASFMQKMAEIAQKYGMTIHSCAESDDFSRFGITQGACVDAGRINKIWGLNLPAKKDPGQREHCLCAPSKDIGVPDTCVHGCLYCYATVNHALAKKRHQQHDPAGEMLWGKAPAHKKDKTDQQTLGLFRDGED